QETNEAICKRPSNDNRRAPVSMGRSTFPEQAFARIHKPSRAVTTSGRARAKNWRLTFERYRAPFIEPLMGWTGGDDTLTQVELSFPTLEAAIRYAERQGLSYTISAPTGSVQRVQTAARTASDFVDLMLERLGLIALRESYGRAIADAANRNDPQGADTWTSPMDVVRAGNLPLDAKRAILVDWAWTEYLIDQATNEGMPENGRPSRLDEVEQALLALERRAAPAAEPALESWVAA